MSNEIPAPAPSDFIRDIVKADLASGKYKTPVTRFPPEPNGYLHIGHAKSICLNFGIAREFGGICNLRFDDTNPTKEEVEYVESIIADVNWLIGGWADDRLGYKAAGTIPEQKNGDFYLPSVVERASSPFPASRTNGQDARSTSEPFYASDYFDALYEYAVQLIKKGKAYVCDHTPEEVDFMRGAPDRAGEPSKYRDRPIAESLDLFTRMKNGEFPDGTRTLRAKIDMTSSNIWLRDPLIYRIRHAEHHHTGAKWCIYPLYDFAHCLSDYIEGITHSICTLEFEVHRPLYDWILENLDLPRPLPHQYEFAKLIPTYTIVSKRKLITLVNDHIVTGWDDPRLPTISGLRRRGIPASAVRQFAYNIGVTKYNSVTDIAVFEHCIREDLNRRALRRLAVLRPLKVVITNLPENHHEELDAINNPEDPTTGTRKLPFSRELWIEQDDFAEVPPPKFFRLKPGGEVRLKYAYIIKCDEVIKDPTGKVVELRCTADLDSKTGGPTSARKIKGTIHWVSAAHAIDAECRLYDRLFTAAEPDADGDFKKNINPHSLEVVTCKAEPSVKSATPELRYQFERLGYFALDVDSTTGKQVFNRTITLKDTWAKIEKAEMAQPREKRQQRTITTDDTAFETKLREAATRFSPHVGMALVLPHRKAKPHEVLRNGTISLVDTGQRKILLTAAHVYEFFEQERAKNPNTVLAITGANETQPVNISDALLIDKDRRRLDLAVLEFQHNEILQEAGKQFFRAGVWPPRRAVKGDLAFTMGYPEIHREASARGLEVRLTPICDFVSSSSDRHFILADEGMVRRVVKANPHLTNFGSLSGMSGCSAYVQREGEATWSLAGIVYEASDTEHATIFFTHIDFITSTGQIDRNKIPW